MMITLTIDNRQVQVPPGTTVLQAAAAAGIRIPTLCWREDFEPSTSCMLCVVDVEGFQGLLPSCTLTAENGMQVRTDTPAIQAARRAALELLLSDHIGDCEGPCRSGCPADMDIPRMIRSIADGDFRRAIEIIKRDIALPAVLGRICPAPCEKVCRRARQDQPLSICLLKRFAADADLQSSDPFRPVCRPPTGKKVAIVGAGPCGLSAASSLARNGHTCVLFEQKQTAGGMLRCSQLQEKIPPEILDKEIKLIFDLGVSFHPDCRLGYEISLQTLQREFDAVFLATGQAPSDGSLSSIIKADKALVDRSTFQTSLQGVFAGGGLIGRGRLAVKSIADGKNAALAIHQFLTAGTAVGKPSQFHSRLGTLTEHEWRRFAGSADPAERLEPADPMNGFTPQEALAEARRCLHCDCRKKKNCKLRQLSSELKAVGGTYKGQRREYARADAHPEVVFESGKCIQCGLCVQVLNRNGLSSGLTFRGRGVGVKIAAALDAAPDLAVGQAARLCVQVCPTGAWALKTR